VGFLSDPKLSYVGSRVLGISKDLAENFEVSWLLIDGGCVKRIFCCANSISYFGWTRSLATLVESVTTVTILSPESGTLNDR
jgi:hypothetical protein